MLIFACIGAFLFQVGLQEDVEGFIAEFGFTPAIVGAALATGEPQTVGAGLLTVLTSMFLHGGWFHVIGNLLYLRVFGDNVEDRLGHLPFLLFYIASGFAGAFGQWLIHPTSSTPMVGASGAVAGVLGAYIVLFPRARVLTLFPVFIFLTFIEVPAVVFLGIWAAQQFLNGYLVLGETVAGGVAWFAHIGGFVLGLGVGGVARALGRR